MKEGSGGSRNLGKSVGTVSIQKDGEKVKKEEGAVRYDTT